MRLQQRIRRDQARHTDDWLITYADTITLLLCLFVITLTMKTGVKPPMSEANSTPAQTAAQEGVFWGLPAIRSFSPISEAASDAIAPAPIRPAAATEPQVANAEDTAKICLYTAAGQPIAGGRSGAGGSPGAVRNQAGTGFIARRCRASEFPGHADRCAKRRSHHHLANRQRGVFRQRFRGTEQRREGHSQRRCRHFGIEGVCRLSHHDRGSHRRYADQHAAISVQLGIVRRARRRRCAIPARTGRSGRQAFTASGYADTVPIAPNRTADGTVIAENQARNRRVVIRLERIDKAKQ